MSQQKRSFVTVLNNKFGRDTNFPTTNTRKDGQLCKNINQSWSTCSCFKHSHSFPYRNCIFTACSAKHHLGSLCTLTCRRAYVKMFWDWEPDNTRQFRSICRKIWIFCRVFKCTRLKICQHEKYLCQKCHQIKPLITLRFWHKDTKSFNNESSVVLHAVYILFRSSMSLQWLKVPPALS